MASWTATIAHVEAGEFNRAFGELVKKWRRNGSLTQAELGKKLGLSRTSIVNIEHGRQGIPLSTLPSFADALGCAPHDLIPVPASGPAVNVLIGDDDPDGRAFLNKFTTRPKGKPRDA